MTGIAYEAIKRRMRSVEYLRLEEDVQKQIAAENERFRRSHEQNVATTTFWCLLCLLSPEVALRLDAGNTLFALADFFGTIQVTPTTELLDDSDELPRHFLREGGGADGGPTERGGATGRAAERFPTKEEAIALLLSDIVGTDSFWEAADEPMAGGGGEAWLTVDVVRSGCCDRGCGGHFRA